MDDDEYLLDGEEGKGGSEEPVDGEESTETKKKKEKKGKKGKKKGGRAAVEYPSDGEDEIKLGYIPGNIAQSEEEEEEDIHRKGRNSNASAFHMLLEEEDEEEEEEPSGTSAATGFDLLAEENDEDGANDEAEEGVEEGGARLSPLALLEEGEGREDGSKEEMERREGSAHAGGSDTLQLVVATIVSVQKHPKADRLR